jgi:murein DD-endopeptidase MepM/ murein hydrolase activator NlpD
VDPRPSDLDPYPRGGRDLATLEIWEQSLARSRQRRRLHEASRSHRQRRRGTSMAVSAAMLASPMVPLAGAKGSTSARSGAVAPLDLSSLQAATDGAAALLREGDTGAAVAAVQRRLAIAADGIFGPVTERSVLTFQRDRGIGATGVVDARTWSALFDGGVVFVDGPAASARADAPARTVRVVLGDEEQEPTRVTDRPDAGEAAPEVESEGAGGGDAPAAVPVEEPEPEPEGSSPSSTVTASGCTTGTAATPVKGTVTGRFGEDRGDHAHSGLDIAAPTGTPVHAAQCGTVVQSGARGDGYGIMVCVRHAGAVTTCYAHLSRAKATVNAKVGAGETIGYVGCTGSCTGPHVHVEVRRNGHAEDPTPYLSGQRTVSGSSAAKATTATLASTRRASATSAGTSTGGATATAEPAAPVEQAAPVAEPAAPVEQAAPAVASAPAPA